MLNYTEKFAISKILVSTLFKNFKYSQAFVILKYLEVFNNNFF